MMGRLEILSAPGTMTSGMIWTTCTRGETILCTIAVRSTSSSESGTENTPIRKGLVPGFVVLIPSLPARDSVQLRPSFGPRFGAITSRRAATSQADLHMGPAESYRGLEISDRVIGRKWLYVRAL